MFFNDPETIKKLTPEWTGERMADGRPFVSDDILNRMRKITYEEAWGTIYRKGYKNNWQSDFRTTNGDKVLVGRAVTVTYMPFRPDLHNTLINIGHNEEGRKGNYNQWVIDNLVEHDVVVVDLYDKIFEGTFVGGNLSTAIRTKTVDGGAVIWGGLRDLQQIVNIEGLQIFYRGADPTGINDCLITSINMPCRIGRAVCMPGDIVMGTISGVLFIPAQYAEEVVVNAEKSHIRDVFGFDRLRTGTYTTAQIDTRWTTPMMEDFLNWLATDPRAEEYRHLTWDEEMEEAKKKDAEGNTASIRL